MGSRRLQKVGGEMYDTDVRQDPDRPRMVLRRRAILPRLTAMHIYLCHRPCIFQLCHIHASAIVAPTHICLFRAWRPLSSSGWYFLLAFAAVLSPLRVTEWFGMPSVDLFDWMPLFGNQVPAGVDEAEATAEVADDAPQNVPGFSSEFTPEKLQGP